MSSQTSETSRTINLNGMMELFYARKAERWLSVPSSGRTEVPVQRTAILKKCRYGIPALTGSI